MDTDTRRSTPALVGLARRLEQTSRLDPLVRAARPLAAGITRDPRVRDALTGQWLGHAVHPLLTDVPIGTWTSAMLLDLVGGTDARPAARRLIAIGIATAVPTAVTGWAEYSGIERTREQRVAVVHAVSNVTALGLYVASYRARRRSQHARGKALALGGGLALSAGGYLGGHLVSARKVSSRHPAFGSPAAAS